MIHKKLHKSSITPEERALLDYAASKLKGKILFPEKLERARETVRKLKENPIYKGGQ